MGQWSSIRTIKTKTNSCRELNMKSENALKMIKLNDEHAKVYDSVTIFNFYWNHLVQILNELDIKNNGIYLDAGCGTGNLFKINKKGETFVGIDYSRQMLEKAKEKCEHLIRADLHHLPLRNECLDGVVNVNVLYQLENPQKFLKETYRILKKGGKVIISTPREGSSLLSFTPAFLKALFKNPGIFLRLKKLIRYGRINQELFDTNPNTRYNSQQLEEMMSENFKIEKIIKAYVNQNWLVSAYKSE